jgi:prepilin-type processing-associated H-X9-DG protein/prepilin-type N-terminal cleavage/methylation domain-containing protein
MNPHPDQLAVPGCRRDGFVNCRSLPAGPSAPLFAGPGPRSSAGPCAQSQIANRKSKIESSFTLIELLVVSAVIAILAALLLPALGRAKRGAYSARCMGNLHQLGIALQLYLQDNHAYPLATSGRGLGSWHRALRSYANDPVFFCPQEIPATTDWLALFPSPTVIHPHYGYNFVGAARRQRPALNPGLGGDFILNGAKGEYRPAPESRVIAPARVIALGDSPAFIRPPASAIAALTRDDPLYIAFPFNFPAWGYVGVGNWHDGGANMVFCDGHVESASQSLWNQASDARRRLWNSDNQPHEESW